MSLPKGWKMIIVSSLVTFAVKSLQLVLYKHSISTRADVPPKNLGDSDNDKRYSERLPANVLDKRWTD